MSTWISWMDPGKSQANQLNPLHVSCKDRSGNRRFDWVSGYGSATFPHFCWFIYPHHCYSTSTFFCLMLKSHPGRHWSWSLAGLFVPPGGMGSRKHVAAKFWMSHSWAMFWARVPTFHRDTLLICPGCHSKFETLETICLMCGRARRKPTFVTWGGICWHFARGASSSCESYRHRHCFTV